MSVFLEPVDGKGLKIALDKAIVFIGRHPECDLVITRSRMISRKHCAIVQINNAFVIRDLGSTNGVRVNGARVQKECGFTIGDTVTIGDLEYAVKHQKTPEPERRANRDHPQDARGAGSMPVRGEAPRASEQFSQEIPIAIPEDEEFDNEAVGSDTPDSIPVVAKRERSAGDDADRPLADDSGPRRRRPFLESDSHLPSADR